MNYRADGEHQKREQTKPFEHGPGADMQKLRLPNVIWFNLALYFHFGIERSYPPMTGGWAAVGVDVVGLIGHSVGCLVRWWLR